jgi:uncharacterized phiE125 gp8 family phage protein
MTSLTLVSPPHELVTVEEARAYVRQDGTADDTILALLVAAARQHIESAYGLALVTQTWDWRLDRFPDASTTALRVPLPPLQAVLSITYLDADGDTQTWATDQYTVDATRSEPPTPGRILPAYGVSWPSTRDVVNAVTVRFTAGFGTSPATVPPPIRWAIQALVAHLYANREPVILTGGVGSPVAMPMHVDHLLANYRTWSWTT